MAGVQQGLAEAEAAGPASAAAMEVEPDARSISSTTTSASSTPLPASPSAPAYFDCAACGVSMRIKSLHKFGGKCKTCFVKAHTLAGH